MRFLKTWIEMDAERVELVKRLLGNKRGRLLDIGCWKDYKHFEDLNCEFYGLDIVKACKMPHFVQQDLNKNTQLPFRSNFFDIIFAFEVLEHLCFPEEIINEIKRVIKPDGIILISLPNDCTWDARIKFLFGKEDFFQFKPDGKISEKRHRIIFSASTAKRWIEQFFPVDRVEYLGRFFGQRFLPAKIRNWLAKIQPNLFCRVQLFKIKASDFK
jgi:SAM-dependent methyltransferase